MGSRGGKGRGRGRAALLLLQVDPTNGFWKGGNAVAKENEERKDTHRITYEAEK